MKQASTTQMRVTDIVVGPRQRKDLGDLAGLARSIEQLGFLQPLAVAPGGRPIGGQRRLQAAIILGLEMVPVHVCHGLDDALTALRAEQAENCERKPFTPSEAVRLGRELERLLSEEARRRRRAGTSPDGRAGGRGRRKENLVANGHKVSPKTRDQVGEAVGLGGRTFARAKAVVEAAEEDEERFGDLVEAMDRTGRVDGVHRRLQVRLQADAIAAEPPPLPRGPFRVVVADPPWTFDRRAGDDSRRGVCPYPTMTTAEIQALPVGRLAADDAVLWLWCPNSHIEDALAVAGCYGFTCRTLLTWVKPGIGLGDWLRGRSEQCLLCTRGRPVVTLGGQSTVLEAPAGRHSDKPDTFYHLVETLCPGSKVELFAPATPRLDVPRVGAAALLRSLTPGSGWAA